MAYNTKGKLLWLADVIRAAGLPVYEMPGWKDRGHGDFTDCRGVIAHHTASGNASDEAALNIVCNGVSGLQGPLSQLGLGKSGTVWVIASGVAWHAGEGNGTPWLPVDNGNWYSIGIEGVSAGTRDDWTPAQRENYPKLVACLLKALGQNSSRLVAHREYSTAGKIDPAYWDMTQFRAQVQKIIDGSTGPTPSSTDPDEEDEMATAPISPAITDGRFSDVPTMAQDFPPNVEAKGSTHMMWANARAAAAAYRALRAEQIATEARDISASNAAKLDQILAKLG